MGINPKSRAGKGDDVLNSSTRCSYAQYKLGPALHEPSSSLSRHDLQRRSYWIGNTWSSKSTECFWKTLEHSCAAFPAKDRASRKRFNNYSDITITRRTIHPWSLQLPMTVILTNFSTYHNHYCQQMTKNVNEYHTDDSLWITTMISTSRIFNQ